jgi:preprotein translocase SecE subunit
MSSSVQELDGKKWIQTFLVIMAAMEVYILINFFQTLNGWFELESYIKSYKLITEVLSVLISLATFIYVLKHKVAYTYLSDVFSEATKVIWPNQSETFKSTIIIMILVTIIGTILWFFDLLGTGFLSLF